MNPTAGFVPAPETSGAGAGRLEVRLVSGLSAATGVRALSPLKILVPKPRGPSVWAYTSGLGGGYVAGDQTRLEVIVGEGARCFLGTQSSTKIYRNPDGFPCRHDLLASSGPDAVLVLAPDPVQCFAKSIYEQRQRIELASSSGLVLVDWLGSGRAACGERWDFSRYCSRTDVVVDGKPVLIDSVSLDPRDGVLSDPARMGRFNCVALLLLMGEPMRANAECLLAEIATLPISRRSGLVCSASPVPGGALLRMAGAGTEQVGHELCRRLRFVAALLGDDPWARKW